MNTSRRTVLKTAAWSAPAITVAAAAPAFADSTPIRLDPGINGWVQVSYGTSYGFDATFDSDPAGTDPATPDGAPFGLYIYDAVSTDGTVVPLGGASITLWFRGRVGRWTYGSRDNNSNGGGHGSGWSSPVYVGTESKPDGLTYHGYRFDYSGGYAPLSDGRVYLQDFEVTAKTVASGDATFWVERKIVVDGELQAFQRRNGERGSMGDGFPSASSRARSFAHPSGVTVVMA